MVMHSNQSVKQRVDQMILGAKQQFGCSIVINQSNRSAEQAQQFHICHMFLHNFFKYSRVASLFPIFRCFGVTQMIGDPSLGESVELL
jgi:hypothetical protein